jgi:hypothetical protein
LLPEASTTSQHHIYQLPPSFLVLGDEFCSKYKMPPRRKVQTAKIVETPTGNSSSLSARQGKNKWI